MFLSQLVLTCVKPCNFAALSNRYFLRVVIVRRLSDITKELDVAVHTLSHFPEMNNSLKMEVGIEDCLHIEFEYSKSKSVLTGMGIRVYRMLGIGMEYRNGVLGMRLYRLSLL